MAGVSSDIAAIERIIRLIEDSLHESLSAESLAAELGYSERHLQRVFKAATGEPLGRFIRRRRLEKAARLLTETNEPVIAVADRVGYSSHAGFTRAFSAHFAMAPSERQKISGQARELPGALHTNLAQVPRARIEVSRANTGDWRDQVYWPGSGSEAGERRPRSHRLSPWQPLRRSARDGRPHPWRR